MYILNWNTNAQTSRAAPWSRIYP